MDGTSGNILNDGGTANFKRFTQLHLFI